MHNWTPLDLPFLRQKAVETLDDSILLWQRAPLIPGFTEEDRQDTISAIRVFQQWMDAVPLTWLDSDVCDLVADTFNAVPEWTPEAAMPSPNGLIAFEKSPVELVWTGGADGQRRKVPLDLLMWTTDGDRIAVSALSRMGEHRAHLAPAREHIPFDEVLSISFDIDQTAGAGRDVNARATSEFTGRFSDGERLLSLAGATWLLLGQPSFVEEEAAPTVKVKNRRAAPGQPKVMPVKVSQRRLTRTINDTQDTASPGGRKQRRSPEKRWWVRGHWRQQAWGKNRALRKPVFIAPHTAGPKDAPVDERPQVQVVRK